MQLRIKCNGLVFWLDFFSEFLLICAGESTQFIYGILLVIHNKTKSYETPIIFSTPPECIAPCSIK
jgi:hypothetical protein